MQINLEGELLRVCFLRPGGVRTEVKVAEGETVMRTALSNGIYEISGECGGVLACATCHVYVDEAFADRFPPPEEDENEMLDCTEAPRKPTSRLSCQLVMTAETDGVVVTVGSED
jgi:2Fe-2S ferredoxin